MLKDVTKRRLRVLSTSLDAYEALHIVKNKGVIQQFKESFSVLKKRLKELRDVANWLKDKGLSLSTLSAAPTKGITLADLEELTAGLEEELNGHSLDSATMKHLLLFITKKSSLFTFFAEKKRGKAKVLYIFCPQTKS